MTIENEMTTYESETHFMIFLILVQDFLMISFEGRQSQF